MPIPRIDAVYEQTTSLDWSEHVTCPSCHARWKASVRATAVGKGRALYGIGRDAARDRSRIDAFENASAVGKRIIERARCPRCGHRNAAGTSLRGFGLGLLIGLFVVSPVAAVLVELGRNAVVSLLLDLVGIPAFAAWYGRRVRRREFREADAAVVFESVP